MRYLILLYQEETAHAHWSQEQIVAHFEEYSVITNEMCERGIMEAGDPLKPSRTATTVRVRNGETLVVDHTFSEAKAQIGGFYVLNCQSLDEAIALAAKLPTAADAAGAIEIRPILEYE
jgi:hypothetical protein